MPHLERGRAAYERREWRTAWECLTQADEECALAAADLWLLSTAALLTGRDEACEAALQRAQRLHQESGEAAAAARCAFWIGFHLTARNEMARASGWFARASRLLDEAGGEHVERGYLLLPAAFQQLTAGSADAAARIAGDAAQIGRRFGDRDLIAFALHLSGRALIADGRVRDGLALLDEAMISVASDELSPPITGFIYCSVIGACRSVYAVGRAHEWTTALTHWCERQPDIVAYSGECRVYRSELLQLQGEWNEAVLEARRAGERLSERGGPAAALALYQQGELQRMLGDFDAAERAYRAASHAGREPQPGLSLLRMAQGDVDAAASGIRRAMAETTNPLSRARLLPAHIEIMVTSGDLLEARRACGELAELAAQYDSSALQAMAAHACGAVALAAGETEDALRHLRAASRAWHELDAPYEAARTRLLLARACRALGDDEGADLELEAARMAFNRLGAAADLARLDEADVQREHGNDAADHHGLTRRELEVLALVATGKTSRAIADTLCISEKTVARHLSNIYGKLGLSTRAAATAYAYEHGLVRGSEPE